MVPAKRQITHHRIKDIKIRTKAFVSVLKLSCVQGCLHNLSHAHTHTLTHTHTHTHTHAHTHTHTPPYSLGFVILKLDVETVLNPDLHLERVDHVWIGGEGVYCHVHLLDNVRQPPHNHHTQEVPCGERDDVIVMSLAKVRSFAVMS